MDITRRHLLGGSALVVAAGSLAACGTSGSSTGSGASASASGSAGGASGSTSGGSVTIYSADGLGDWYKEQFAAFTAKTGTAVNYVEAGSGEVVSRAEKEKSNPQADVLVTLPPFIQQAGKRGLLQASGIDLSNVAAADKASDGTWVSLCNNYFAMIRNLKASPKPDAWSDLLASTYKQKVQYSTPGQAGDGTALLVLLMQVMGKGAAMSYLGKLQSNNVGPSSSTGKLGPKVSTGELLVANSDVQMALQSIAADKSNYEVFFPKDDSGKRSTVALPYAMGLAANAPHKDAGVALMTFLLGDDVQATLPTKAYGYPVSTKVKPSGSQWDVLQKVTSGVTISTPDWNTIVDELDDDVAAYDKATGQ